MIKEFPTTTIERTNKDTLRFIVWNVAEDGGYRSITSIVELPIDYVCKRIGKTERSKKPFKFGGLYFSASEIRRVLRDKEKEVT